MKLIKAIISCLASVIDRIVFNFFACCRISISQSTRWSTTAKWLGGHLRPDLVQSKSTWCCSTRFLLFFRSRKTGFCSDVPRQLSKVSSSSTVPSWGLTSSWSKMMPEVGFFASFCPPKSWSESHKQFGIQCSILCTVEFRYDILRGSIKFSMLYPWYVIHPVPFSTVALHMGPYIRVESIMTMFCCRLVCMIMLVMCVLA